jgi:hypothetical protein
MRIVLVFPLFLAGCEGDGTILIPRRSADKNILYTVFADRPNISTRCSPMPATSGVHAPDLRTAAAVPTASVCRATVPLAAVEIQTKKSGAGATVQGNPHQAGIICQPHPGFDERNLSRPEEIESRAPMTCRWRRGLTADDCLRIKRLAHRDCIRRCSA